MVSATYSDSDYYEPDIRQYSGLDIQAWNVSTGEKLWRKYYPEEFKNFAHSEFDDILYLSSDGEYLVFLNSIFDLKFNQTIILEKPLMQTTHQNLFGVKNSSKSIDVFYADNYTKQKTIFLNLAMENRLKLQPSPTSPEIAFLPRNFSTLYLMNLTTEEFFTLENITGFNISQELMKYDLISHRTYDRAAYQDNKIIWSKNGEKVALRFIEYLEEYSIKDHSLTYGSYSSHIFIWNAENGLLLNHIELPVGNVYCLNNQIDKVGIPELSPNFEKYGYYYVDKENLDYENKNYGNGRLIINDTSNLQNMLNLPIYDSTDCEFAWSNENKIATGNEDGIIFIWDANTGEKINELRTPIHAIDLPGFELIIFISAIFIALYLLKKNKS